MNKKLEIRLNLGCGGRPLEDYINIDMDTLEQIRLRYPNQTFSEDLIVEQHDIFNLPYEDHSVEEVRSEGLIEHLPFIDEPRFFFEIITGIDFDSTGSDLVSGICSTEFDSILTGSEIASDPVCDRCRGETSLQRG